MTTPITSPSGEATTEVPAGPQFPAPGSGDTAGTDGWPDRFAAAIADAMARRTDRKSLRDRLKARRDAGLRKRHADKLARSNNTPSYVDPLTPPGGAPPMPRTELEHIARAMTKAERVAYLKANGWTRTESFGAETWEHPDREGWSTLAVATRVQLEADRGLGEFK